MNFGEGESQTVELSCVLVSTVRPRLCIQEEIRSSLSESECCCSPALRRAIAAVLLLHLLLRGRYRGHGLLEMFRVLAAEPFDGGDQVQGA